MHVRPATYTRKQALHVPLFNICIKRVKSDNVAPTYTMSRNNRVPTETAARENCSQKCSAFLLASLRDNKSQATEELIDHLKGISGIGHVDFNIRELCQVHS